MQLVHKISLVASIAELPLRDSVYVPFSLFKESTTRATASRLAKKTGRKYTASCDDEGVIITRTL